MPHILRIVSTLQLNIHMLHITTKVYVNVRYSSIITPNARPEINQIDIIVINEHERHQG